MQISSLRFAYSNKSSFFEPIFFVLEKDHRPVFHGVTDVYNTTALVEHPSQSWGKRAVTKHHQHHVTVSQHRHEHKKETQQLSPVKKRVKESTPPSSMRRHSPTSSSHWQEQSVQSHHHSSKHSSSHNVEHQPITTVRQQTITIDDSPSPAVSVITISSDSEDEAPEKW